MMGIFGRRKLLGAMGAAAAAPVAMKAAGSVGDGVSLLSSSHAVPAMSSPPIDLDPYPELGGRHLLSAAQRKAVSKAEKLFNARRHVRDSDELDADIKSMKSWSESTKRRVQSERRRNERRELAEEMRKIAGDLNLLPAWVGALLEDD